MAEHLLAISIGPIQDFIAAARRTRDLWFGSELLSRVSKSAAAAVSRSGTLIFPAPSALEGNRSVANVVLASIRDGISPKAVATEARKQAEGVWMTNVDEAYREVREIVRVDLWNEQANGVLEFYAAWAPLGADYPASRRRVMGLLNGRKACRDFQPAPERPGVPKSSLDGARETVLDREKVKQMSRPLKRLLRLSEGEQLDLVGLVKRAATSEGYRSVSRIAAHPWLHGLAPADRAALIAVCEPLRRHGLISIPDDEFRFEGNAVYRMRHKELAKETGTDEAEYQELGNVVKRLEKTYGKPEPYVAFLRADGDRMGQRISKLDEILKHQQFSERLAAFADGARKIVEARHGVTIYAGGDDVLAMVPVNEAIACAKELHAGFAVTGGTLSAGIAIGHVMDPMEARLGYASAAEKHAKEGEENAPDDRKRDGIAIHVHPRSGAPIELRAQWKDGFIERLEGWSTLHVNNEIGDKAGYDLRHLAEEYRGWSESLFQRAFTDDAARLLKRKKGTQEALEKLKALLGPLKTPDEARACAEELIAARRIAAATRQAGGSRQ